MNMELTQILSIINTIILIGIPLLMWYLDKKTTKEIEKLKIREDFKVQTYKRLFDMFNSILTKEDDFSWTPKNRIDLTVDLLKYAPDDIIKVYFRFWEKAKKGDMSKVDLTPLYEELLLLVRQDLGYVNTKIKSDDVVKMASSSKSMVNPNFDHPNRVPKTAYDFKIVPFTL